MANKIQLRRDSAAVWTSINPTLSDGELGFETDTKYAKIGDGSTPWRALAYLQAGPAVDPTPAPPAPTPPSPPPGPTPPPPPSGPDTRPRYGAGSATAGETDAAALLASMTATGSNGSVAATFTVATGTGQYGWFACLASASTSGVTFTDAFGTGGWQGAGFSGPNGADDGSSPNTSTVLATISSVQWRFFRQSYAEAGGEFTTS